MAVNKNPYASWQNLRNTSDYRSRETQISAFTRQQLSQDDYLLNSNRVNPGPQRNKRALIASSVPQLPHPVGSEDMWGWQSWVESNISSSLSTGLKEKISLDQIPGANYSPLPGKVGGASN